MHLKSPLRYPGGKSRLVETISKIAPKDFTEYREPFLGGGSVLMRIAEDYPGKRYWGNDLYYDLFCFWTICQQYSKELEQRVREIKEEWENKGKDLHKYLSSNIADMNVFERAAAFFILNRITFSGTILSGGFSSSAFKDRFTDSSISKITRTGQLLNTEDIILTNEDYSIVLQGGDENTFSFLDPPYYKARNLYGRKGELHKGFDHERLAETLRNCNHKWLMTYDDCEYIRALYKDYNIKEYELMYGMNNVGNKTGLPGNEIFISNYEL